jgi:uncharacterized protein YaiI (UPF0178 family)
MQIWVDADACPKVIKDILFRLAERLQIPVTLVANKLLRIPPSRYIRAIQVAAGFDVADREIVALAQPDDLVITADIPLASDILQKGAHALNPRGEFYTPDNIAQALSMRNFLEELRGSGVETGGPAPFSASETHAFARQLERYLVQRGIKQKPSPGLDSNQ